MHRLTERDIANQTGVCSECGPVSIKVRKGKSPECRNAVNEAARKRYIQNKENPHRRVGKTAAETERLRQYGWLWIEQGGKCAICGKPGGFDVKRLCVDHDHETGKTRGLLCKGCNTALGHFGDSIEGLIKVIEYLQKASNPRR